MNEIDRMQMPEKNTINVGGLSVRNTHGNIHIIHLCCFISQQRKILAHKVTMIHTRVTSQNSSSRKTNSATDNTNSDHPESVF